MFTRAALALVGTLALLGVSAVAAPPEHADPALAEWFRSLVEPTPNQWSGLHASCCSVSDGRAVEAEHRTDGNWWALVGSQFPDGPSPPIWVRVPPETVLQRTDNPTGKPVLFWTKNGVRCFVRPPET